MVDFSSIYDLPAQTLPDKTAFTDVMGGSCDDICSPVFTKMDPNGCELLSLDELSNSEFDYLNSDGTYALCTYLAYLCLYIHKVICPRQFVKINFVTDKLTIFLLFSLLQLLTALTKIGLSSL